jgi:hypothetical protein
MSEARSIARNMKSFSWTLAKFTNVDGHVTDLRQGKESAFWKCSLGLLAGDRGVPRMLDRWIGLVGSA